MPNHENIKNMRFSNAMLAINELASNDRDEAELLKNEIFNNPNEDIKNIAREVFNEIEEQRKKKWVCGHNWCSEISIRSHAISESKLINLSRNSNTKKSIEVLEMDLKNNPLSIKFKEKINKISNHFSRLLQKA